MERTSGSRQALPLTRSLEEMAIRRVLGMPVEWRVALSLVLAVIGGGALLTEGAHHWTSDARTWMRVEAMPSRPQLSTDAEMLARRALERMSRYVLQEWKLRQDGGAQYIAWTMAQAVVSDPSTKSAADVGEFFQSTRLRACACWAVDDRHPQTAASAWVAMALTSVREPSAGDVVDWLADVQRKDGAWALYPLNVRAASTFATTVAILAVDEYIATMASGRELVRLRETVKQGRRWLLDHVSEESGLWSLYPALQPGERSRAASALVIHALWRTRSRSGNDTAAVLQRWLETRPTIPPVPSANDSASLVLSMASADERLVDRVRSYTVPWTVIAMVDAYPLASRVQRFRMLEELEAYAMRAGSVDPQLNRQTWLVAETVLALRHLLGPGGI